MPPRPWNDTAEEQVQEECTTDKTYTVQITVRQLHLIAWLRAHMKYNWLRKQSGLRVDEQGELRGSLIFSCAFCHKASISPDDIQHATTCLVPDITSASGLLESLFEQVEEQA